MCGIRTLVSSPLDKLNLEVKPAISGDSNICVGTGSLLSPFSFRPASVLVLEDDDEEEDVTSSGVPLWSLWSNSFSNTSSSNSPSTAGGAEGEKGRDS